MAVASDIPMRQRMEEYVCKLQEDIVTAFEKLDPNAPTFKRDSWLRAEGGRGVSCIFAVPAPGPGVEAAHQETVLEKGGVNVSIVHGMLLEFHSLCPRYVLASTCFYRLSDCIS